MLSRAERGGDRIASITQALAKSNLFADARQQYSFLPLHDMAGGKERRGHSLAICVPGFSTKIWGKMRRQE